MNSRLCNFISELCYIKKSMTFSQENGRSELLEKAIKSYCHLHSSCLLIKQIARAASNLTLHTVVFFFQKILSISDAEYQKNTEGATIFVCSIRCVHPAKLASGAFPLSPTPLSLVFFNVFCDSTGYLTVFQPLLGLYSPHWVTHDSFTRIKPLFSVSEVNGDTQTGGVVQ